MLCLFIMKRKINNKNKKGNKKVAIDKGNKVIANRYYLALWLASSY